MLRSLSQIKDRVVTDLSNELVGQASDFYFDDIAWTIRYLVVDTGTWLPGRKVLISPNVLGQPQPLIGTALPIRLTRQQIEQSPSVERDQPVSRQQEEALARHFDWPDYWNRVTFLDARAIGMDPDDYLRSMRQMRTEQAQHEAIAEDVRQQRVDPHLQSAEEVIGYYIHAQDGDIGHVEDFVVETESWIIRYMVIDTRNWLPGRKVLVDPAWIEQVNWAESKVYMAMTRDAVKHSPEYDPIQEIDREYENALYEHYSWPKYWL